MKKLKIRICTFDVAKYGGIVKNIESRIESFKKMGHDVDIIFLSYQKTINVNSYENKIKELESGKFQAKQDHKSQFGGYSKSEITGYWRNSYYGWLLPPYKNRIPVFHENALEMWREAVEDVDLLFWSFAPTKQNESKGFNFWHKFFDLPETTKQVMAIHDGYFDMRNPWIKYLEPKISFLDCVHLSAFNCCQNFDIPRQLNFASRTIPDKMPILKKSDRNIDYFAAHVFKTMKRMQELLALAPYLDKGSTMFLAGSGIELYYMAMDEGKDNLKQRLYEVNKKTDPDCDKKDIGMSLWNRAKRHGMEHFGFMTNEDVYMCLQNCKFAVDPSFSKHYAKYSQTHLNGFTIEAIINGAYPVLRDTEGLTKPECEIDDIIRKEIRAVYVPHDVTPKQFAQYMNEAMKMSDKKYLKDTMHNFDVAKELFNPENNMRRVLDVAMSNKKISKLDVGTNSKKVEQDGEKIMREFFGYELPIEWEH